MPDEEPKPPRKSKMQLAAEAMAGRVLFRLDDLRLDRLALGVQYTSLLDDEQAVRALKGFADVITARIGIYADELSKQLVPDESPKPRQRGKGGKFEAVEAEVLLPSSPEDELEKAFTLEELEKVSLILTRFNQVREQIALEYREIVPKQKKDNFYVPEQRSYSDWKAEFDETIGSPGRAPSLANAPKTAEPTKTKVKTPKTRTPGSRSSRPI